MNVLCAAVLLLGALQQETRPPPSSWTLLEVAKREAEREAREREERAALLLEDLGSSSDPELAYVDAKVRELASLGASVVPLLEQFVAGAGDSGPAFHRARNAARALALMEAPEAAAALRRLAQHEKPTVRRLAAWAMGLSGDESLLAALVRLAEDPEGAVAVEALRSLGSFPRPDVERRLVAAARASDSAVAAAAVDALRRLPSPGSAPVVLERLRTERSRSSPHRLLLEACVLFLAEHPHEEAFETLREIATDDRAELKLRHLAVRALAAAALADDKLAAAARETLRSLLQSGLGPLVRAAAEALLELGDDSGVEVLVEPLDRLLTNNPRNLGARYQRAELLLSFRRYRSAYRDFMEGLRQEKDPRDPDRVYLGLARATAGMRRFSDAARFLRKLVTVDRAALPEEYPEFREMKEDPRYAGLFERRS